MVLPAEACLLLPDLPSRPSLSMLKSRPFPPLAQVPLPGEVCRLCAVLELHLAQSDRGRGGPVGVVGTSVESTQS